MEILIISGLSGAGKSSAATYLEDMGYYTVDNVPADIILKFAEFCAQSDGRYDRVALVSDAGASPVHRAPATAKLLALIGIGLPRVGAHVVAAVAQESRGVVGRRDGEGVDDAGPGQVAEVGEQPREAGVGGGQLQHAEA